MAGSELAQILGLLSAGLTDGRHDFHIVISASERTDSGSNSADDLFSQQAEDESNASANNSSPLQILTPAEAANTGTPCVGLMNERERMIRTMMLPKIYPNAFVGIRKPCRAIILHGPPGTGKTLLARTTAAACNFNFISVSPAMLLSKWTGDSEKAVSEAFALAKEKAPGDLKLQAEQ